MMYYLSSRAVSAPPQARSVSRAGQEAAARRPNPLGFGLGHRPATSHRQNHAELGVATHHPRISLRRLLEWISFNHRTHAGQFGEVHCVLGIRWCPYRRALDGTLSADEL